jgi:hypothetical protein
MVPSPMTRSPGPSRSPSGSAQSAVVASPSVTNGQDPRVVLSLKVKFPQAGTGRFSFAKTSGRVLGRAGPIRRFSVAIESNIKVADLASFVQKIDETLGDSRSWINSGQFRLQQVPPGESHEFTIYLATPQTTNGLCAPLRSFGYTSCRQGTKVVLNLARWLQSVPYYTHAGMVLDIYRSYMINHEVGHALGHDHELCLGSGKLAPVMEQQTFGLHGCLPNAWPFVHGKRYDGPPGRY